MPSAPGNAATLPVRVHRAIHMLKLTPRNTGASAHYQNNSHVTFFHVDSPIGCSIGPSNRVIGFGFVGVPALLSLREAPDRAHLSSAAHRVLAETLLILSPYPDRSRFIIPTASPLKPPHFSNSSVRPIRAWPASQLLAGNARTRTHALRTCRSDFYILRAAWFASFRIAVDHREADV